MWHIIIIVYIMAYDSMWLYIIWCTTCGIVMAKKQPGCSTHAWAEPCPSCTQTTHSSCSYSSAPLNMSTLPPDRPHVHTTHILFLFLGTSFYVHPASCSYTFAPPFMSTLPLVLNPSHLLFCPPCLLFLFLRTSFSVHPVSCSYSFAPPFMSTLPPDRPHVHQRPQAVRA
jgi:hypothetical protein